MNLRSVRDLSQKVSEKWLRKRLDVDVCPLHIYAHISVHCVHVQAYTQERISKIKQIRAVDISLPLDHLGGMNGISEFLFCTRSGDVVGMVMVNVMVMRMTYDGSGSDEAADGDSGGGGDSDGGDGEGMDICRLPVESQSLC